MTEIYQYFPALLLLATVYPFATICKDILKLAIPRRVKMFHMEDSEE